MKLLEIQSVRLPQTLATTRLEKKKGKTNTHITTKTNNDSKWGLGGNPKMKLLKIQFGRLPNPSQKLALKCDFEYLCAKRDHS